MSKIHALIIAFILLLVATPSSSKELKFLFTTDQNIKTEDIGKIPVNKDIVNDNWFTSPPTRLELLTYTLDQYFQKKFEKFWEDYQINLDEYFERRKDKFTSVTADASVCFYSEKDVIVTKVNIDGLGKPKKPMKDFSDNIMGYISFLIYKPGYLFQRQFLRPFTFGSHNDPKESRAGELLQKNILLLVTLESQYGEEVKGIPSDFYDFQCYRFLNEKENHYSKQAVSAKP